MLFDQQVALLLCSRTPEIHLKGFPFS